MIDYSEPYLKIQKLVKAYHNATLKQNYEKAGVSVSEASCEAFIDNVVEAMVDADILICRAGATTVAEVAAAAGLTTQEVVDALLAGQAHYTSTLEPEVITPTASEDGDDPLARVLDRFDLAPALAIVTDLDRQLLIMRFVDERSQSDIAEALGMDQSTVSRRIARTLVELRAYLSADSELAESRWGTNSPQSAATAGTSSTQP